MLAGAGRLPSGDGGDGGEAGDRGAGGEGGDGGARLGPVFDRGGGISRGSPARVSGRGAGTGVGSGASPGEMPSVPSILRVAFGLRYSCWCRLR